MKSPGWVYVALAALALLTYFQFPGHTYLHQDTQIYVPILENLRDGAVLKNDLLVERPHVAFTLYDELAVTLERVTGFGFEALLKALQLLTRGLGLWGVYLIALALLHESTLALLVSAVCAWGGPIDGPAVLIIEYEPSPRALAIPLLFLSVGLAMWRHPVWAGGVAAVAFVLHPPSALPFWLVFLLIERRIRAWAPIAIASVLLLLAASAQPGVRESQPFLFRIPPQLEMLQRMRAAYNWVSTWWPEEWWKHSLALLMVLLASWRARVGNPFILGLPVIGMLSVPVSFFLLERAKWGLLPQLQPARTLLFGTALAVLMAAVCGCLAVRRRKWIESAAWFFVASVPPLLWAHWWLCVLVAALLVVSVALCSTNLRWLAAPVLAGCFWLIPIAGNIVNYPRLRTPELAELSRWAREHTAPGDVFLFPGAGKRLEAGILRSEALRPIYVDWKGGGQVNYLPDLAAEWWDRWQQVMQPPVDLDRYGALGIAYAVLPAPKAVSQRQAVFQNADWVVYSVAAKAP